MSFPAFAALDREWHRFATHPDTRAALASWPASEPALAGFDSVDDLVAVRRDGARAPEVLTALVSLASTDVVAARVLLQAILPGLIRLTASFAASGRPDTAEHVLAIAWERIRSYGSANRSVFAPNLLLDVRKALMVEWTPPPVGGAARVEPVPSAEDEAISRLFIGEICAMERSGALQPGSTELLVLTRVEGHTLVELAGRRGDVTDHGLLLRRRRAESRLRRELSAA